MNKAKVFPADVLKLPGAWRAALLIIARVDACSTLYADVFAGITITPLLPRAKLVKAAETLTPLGALAGILRAPVKVGTALHDAPKGGLVDVAIGGDEPQKGAANIPKNIPSPEAAPRSDLDDDEPELAKNANADPNPCTLSKDIPAHAENGHIWLHSESGTVRQLRGGQWKLGGQREVQAKAWDCLTEHADRVAERLGWSPARVVEALAAKFPNAGVSRFDQVPSLLELLRLVQLMERGGLDERREE